MDLWHLGVSDFFIRTSDPCQEKGKGSVELNPLPVEYLVQMSPVCVRAALESFCLLVTLGAFWARLGAQSLSTAGNSTAVCTWDFFRLSAGITTENLLLSVEQAASGELLWEPGEEWKAGKGKQWALHFQCHWIVIGMSVKFPWAGDMGGRNLKGVKATCLVARLVLSSQPKWSFLKHSWSTGVQHCLVVKGKEWEIALRAPKGQGEQEIQLQEQGFLCSSQWKCGGANIPWQPVDRTTAEQIPPLHPWRAPTGVFLSQRAAGSGRVPYWSKGKVWGGRSSKEELGTDLKMLSKLLREIEEPGMREQRRAMRRGRCLFLGFFSSLCNSSLFGNKLIFPGLFFVTLICKRSLCLYLNPWAFPSSPLVRRGNESSWVGAWQLVKVTSSGS